MKNIESRTNQIKASDTRKMRIVFLAKPGNFVFFNLNQISEYFASKYEVRKVEVRYSKEIIEAFNWADICLFAWCDELTIHASKLPKTCRIICWLRSYEAFTEMPGQVEWSNVDDLIFVAPHISDIAMQRWQSIGHHTRTHHVPTGVDLERFRFKERQKGYRIAYVGYINHKKGPLLLLHAIQNLVSIDPRYTLHIAGDHQDFRFKLYFDKMIPAMGLKDNVYFYGWVDDIEKWLDDKEYIVVTSPLESGPSCVKEAMACGVKPLIHNFVGAEALYPDKYLFNTIQEFCEMAISPHYNSREYHEFIKRNYSLEMQLSKIDSVIVNEGKANPDEISNKPIKYIPDENN